MRVAGDRISVRVLPRSAVVCVLLLAAAVVVGVFALTTGDYPISVYDVVRTLLGRGSEANEFIVTELRLPRAIAALGVGAALGMAGAVFQSISRNPLGSPDIVGLTVGSATGALLQIIVLGGGPVAVAVGSVVGGILTAVAVYLLAFRTGALGYRLVLVGIGVGAVLESVNSYLLVRSSLTEATAAQFWLTGSLNGRGWEDVRPLVGALVALLPVTFALGRDLRMLEMGDDAARAVGVPVERRRFAALLCGIALTALATATAGPIAFVALVAPQLVRRLTLVTGPNLVPSALMGATLLIVSDFAAQRLLAPTQLPVGVMTAGVGGVYLAWLLTREWRSGRA
nr:iron chelate uptake ABC transporter family permease subunit [Candidatus Protofrankia californiensis]